MRFYKLILKSRNYRQRFLLSSPVVSQSSHWLKKGEGREWKQTRMSPRFVKSHLFVYSGVGVRIEVRGQLAGFCSLLPCGSWDRTQVHRLGGDPSHWPTAHIPKPFSREVPGLNDPSNSKENQQHGSEVLSSHVTSCQL